MTHCAKSSVHGVRMTSNGYIISVSSRDREWIARVIYSASVGAEYYCMSVVYNNNGQANGLRQNPMRFKFIRDKSLKHTSAHPLSAVSLISLS